MRHEKKKKKGYQFFFWRVVKRHPPVAVMDSSTAAASDGDGGSSSSLNVEHDTAAKTTGLDEFLLLLSVRVPNQTDVARIAGAMDKVTKTPLPPQKKMGPTPYQQPHTRATSGKRTWSRCRCRASSRR